MVEGIQHELVVSHPGTPDPNGTSTSVPGGGGGGITGSEAVNVKVVSELADPYNTPIVYIPEDSHNEPPATSTVLNIPLTPTSICCIPIKFPSAPITRRATGEPVSCPST